MSDEITVRKNKWKLLSIFLAGILVATAVSSSATAISLPAIPAAIAAVLAEPNTVNSAAIIDGEVKAVDIESAVALKGSVSVDKPTFSVDSVNNRVGIGVANPKTILEVFSANERVANLTGSSQAFLGLFGKTKDSWAATLYGGGGLTKWSVGSAQFLNTAGQSGAPSCPPFAFPLSSCLPTPPASGVPGNTDFKIGNEQTSTIVMGINGNTNEVNFSDDVKISEDVSVAGDLGCNQCIDGSDIRNQGITSTKLSESFFRLGFKADGTNGWIPDGVKTNFIITNVAQAKDGSRIFITVNNSGPTTCAVYDVVVNGFKVNCNLPPSNGAFLDYVVFNIA